MQLNIGFHFFSSLDGFYCRNYNAVYRLKVKHTTLSRWTNISNQGSKFLWKMTTNNFDKQISSNGRGDFNQFIWLRNQAVVAEESSGVENNFSQVRMPKMSKNKDEQLRVTHKVVDVTDCTKRKIFVNAAPGTIGKTRKFMKNSYAKVQIFAGKLFQQFILAKKTW